MLSDLGVRRDWRDPAWAGIHSVQNGLDGNVQAQRLALFGPNVIDIEGKSTVSLLIDEVHHFISAVSWLLTVSVGHPSLLCLPSR